MTARIVVDTNVYISALRYEGASLRALDEVLTGDFLLLISAPLQEELLRVLHEKFGYTINEINETAASLWRRTEWIAPQQSVHVCADDADNRVLECALAGGAKFIVSGDRQLLELGPVEGLEIVSPNDFLGRMGLSGSEA